MVDKEDSVHIKIKIDVSDEDKAFASKLSSDLEKTDLQKVTPKQKEEKKKKEFIGPPTKTEFEIREIEKLIKKLEERSKKKKLKKKQTPDELLAEKKQELNTLKLKELKEGSVGKLNRMTAKQTANLMEMATNPGNFFMTFFAKKLGRYAGAAKYGIRAIIALLVYELVLFTIDQLMQPGRWLDRRYRRIARVETMNFYARTLQEELRHGYAEIRVTTMTGLRGGQGQVSGNLFEFSSGATGILQSSPYRSSQRVYGHAYLSGSGTDKRGNPKKRKIAGWY